MNDVATAPGIIDISDDALRRWPLPEIDGGDKEVRGCVLVIAGSTEMPGAAVLAATAALRAGAGKLAIATVASAAPFTAIAVPEARVIALAETSAGGIAPPTVADLGDLLRQADAVLIGPGMLDETATCVLVRALWPMLDSKPVVLDAYAMSIVLTWKREPLVDVAPPDASANHRGDPDLGESRACDGQAPPTRTRSAGGHVLLTPHAGEMAHLTGNGKDAVLARPLQTAQAAARQWQVLVALKGEVTHIATPGAKTWRHVGGGVGLATSGSGDVLARIIAGLAARGAPLAQAAACGVALHARAGGRLAQRVGPLGYLARELADEVPGLMHALSPSSAPAQNHHREHRQRKCEGGDAVAETTSR